MLDIANLYLERGGAFSVDTLTSAPEALEQLKTQRYDAIISDYQMPAMDGITFLKQFKESGNTTTPFIIFTGRGREEIVIQALNEGADFYLQKGGDVKSQFAELSHKIRQAVFRRRAEVALSESEERYRSVVNDLTEMIARFTPGGVITFVNEAYHSFFASLLDIQTVEGKNIRDLMLGAGFADMDKLLGSLTPQMPYREIEHVLTGRDGKTHWQIWSVRALFGSGENPTEYQIVGRDITDRKLAEESLRQNEERYRLMNDACLDFVYSYDKSGRFTSANRSLCAAMGLRTYQILGRTHAELGFPAAQCLYWDELHRRVYETGRTVSTLTSSPMPDGTTHEFEVVLNPLHDESGAISGIAGTTRDITDRKRAEDALKESERRYRNVVEDQTELISRFLPGGTHIFVNEAYCRYFHVQRGDIIGKKFSPAIPQEDRYLVREQFASLTKKNPTATVTHRTIMPDGHVHWLRWSDRAIFDDKGAVIEYQSVGRDVTEMKQLEIALQQANRKLSLLSGITRHDINNQLLGLNGFVELLHRKIPEPALEHYFSRITKASSQIASMIHFNKEYEKIGINAPVWQDLQILVNSAGNNATLGPIKLNNDLPASTEVYADPLIAKVMFNLMDNAVRYGGKITTIRFSAEYCNGDRILVCEDDGDGVPADEKERIFERGYGKNTGLGLSLSREILSITGIAIRETGEPGKGARFEITVPKDTWRTTDAHPDAIKTGQPEEEPPLQSSFGQFRTAR
jgi:PAS domain S-box-containing protein